MIIKEKRANSKVFYTCDQSTIDANKVIFDYM